MIESRHVETEGDESGLRMMDRGENCEVLNKVIDKGKGDKVPVGSKKIQPFACDKCKKRYKFKASLDTHKQSKHAECIQKPKEKQKILKKTDHLPT